MRKRLSNPIDDAGESEGFSTSLVRGLQVLRSFRPGDASLGNLELMARTGLPKATVSRLTYTLAGLGYLVYDETLGRYSLGAATISLGYTALSSNAIVHVSRPLMQALADKTGAAVALGTRDYDEMVYISNCRSESLLTLRLNVGSRVPLWNSGMGLAYLVGLPEEQRKLLKHRFLPRARSERATFSKLLEQALDQYARVGYVTALGTWHSYIKAVGVPFTPIDGSPPLAFSCGGTAEVIDEQTIAEIIGPALVKMRIGVEEILSGTPIDSVSTNKGKRPKVGR
ncbi:MULTISPECIES: IclR family transcriptional regulator [unclassified Mesorhizobium]|uniref:IclR family transcriptional regulator n=1 Tax=unclassified Mesorhizobium TaxID=325217 RepID=UPI001FEFE706|nr:MULTISPECIES: IclR family transcriptional regulator [unclassified Mesorhizobium]